MTSREMTRTYRDVVDADAVKGFAGYLTADLRETGARGEASPVWPPVN